MSETPDRRVGLCAPGLRPPRSVLIASLGGLGDFITRWPLWQAVRRSFPQARITYLGVPAHAALGLRAGLFDDVLDARRSRWARPGKAAPPCDLLVSVKGSRSKWWDDLAGGPHTRRIEIEAFPPEGERRPVGDFIAAQAVAAGLEAPGPPACPLGEAEKRWAGAWLVERGIEGARPVVIHPGSGSNAKNWPRERFADLAGRLSGEGEAVILIEGEAETEAAAGPGGEGRWAVAGIVRDAGLPELAALLSRCGAFIGNDSGVSHLAALLGLPAAVIFGPTDPALWAPLGKTVEIVRAATDCAPCTPERRAACGKRICLEAIGVERVLAALLRARKGAADG